VRALNFHFNFHFYFWYFNCVFLIFSRHCFFSFRKTLGLTRGALRPTGEVRLAYGPTLDPFPRCLVLQRYEELFIPTTHVGTTRGYYGGYYGLNKNIKKIPVLTHRDFKIIFTETYFSTHLGSPVIVVG
jgi:hypothetical protein